MFESRTPDQMTGVSLVVERVKYNPVNYSATSLAGSSRDSGVLHRGAAVTQYEHFHYLGVTEADMDDVLACDARYSGFEPRPSPLSSD